MPCLTSILILKWLLPYTPARPSPITMKVKNRAVGIVSTAVTIFNTERSRQRQIHRILNTAAMSIRTVPITGMTHVSVIGYLSRKLIVIIGSAAHTANTITVKIRAHQPNLVFGRIAILRRFSVCGV
jgi:hypothetical protein